MKYDKKYLDQNGYFSANVVIAKESLIRIAMDTSLYGATNIKSAVAVTSLCESYYQGQERRECCRKVMAAREALFKHKEKINELKKTGNKDLVEAEELIYKHMSDDFSRLYQENCHDCPAASKISSAATRRINYGRYHSQNETLSHDKVLLGLHLLIPTVEYLEEDGTGFRCHLVNIRVLSNVCQLSLNSTRESLKYWEEEGFIHTAHYNKGVYAVTFSRSQIETRYKKSSEGGAGYISIPYVGIKAMMEVENVELLRLLIMTYLNLDSDLYDRNFLTSAEGIRGEGQYVRFVRLHHNASYKSLISRFNNDMLRLTGGAIRLSTSGSGDGRYDNIGIFMTHDFAPKQKELQGSIEAEVQKLTRGLSKETTKKIQEFNKEFYGVTKQGIKEYNPWLYFLFPYRDGKDFVRDYDADHLPASLRETFVPALQTINNVFGEGYIFGALQSMFVNMKDKVHRLFNEAKTGTPEFEDLIQELSAYMVGVAGREREAQVQSWKNFEQSA